MNSNKGVTLVSLVASIIIIIILTGLTLSTSLNSYNQMRFEGEKAEIEEVQRKIDEIATDYQNFTKEEHQASADTSYVGYFLDRYNLDIATNKITSVGSSNKNVQNVIEKYGLSDADTTFYFSEDDVVKFFNLKGICPVIVDFATRKVYAPNGIYSTDRKNVYYTPSEWKGDIVVTKAVEKDDARTIEIDTSTVKNSGDFFRITLISNLLFEDVSSVYGVLDSNYYPVDDFKIDSNSKNIMYVSISTLYSGDGEYKFVVVDSLGNSYTTSNIIYCGGVKSYDFSYTGNVQSVILNPGVYKIEAWGAQGGSGSNGSISGGEGGKAEATFSFTTSTLLYVCVGGDGDNHEGYNGGGIGNSTYKTHGGGCTSVATMSGTLKDIGVENINSVLLVAGGGGRKWKNSFRFK